MANELDFEKPIIDLRNKLAELREMSEAAAVDLSVDIQSLESRLHKLEEQIYSNLKAWDRVQIARHPGRPTSLDYLPLFFDELLECKGDRVYGEDEAIVGGIAMFHGIPVTFIGHQRGRDTKENLRRNFGMPHPEGYRKALRLMKQAEKFNRPIICFIDTKGAYPGKAAEERGQSEAIARNLFEMAGLRVPIISVVIGEGGSGGALALGLADKILMLENSTYSVISPEAAASILWRDSSQAKRAAETMKITAPDLKELGIIDDIIPEVRGGAHNNLSEQAKLMGKELLSQLNSLRKMTGEELVNSRYEKFKKIGAYAESKVLSPK